MCNPIWPYPGSERRHRTARVVRFPELCISVVLDSLGRSLPITFSPSQPVLQEDFSSWPARKILLALLRIGIGVGLIAYLAHSRVINFSALSRLVTAWPISIAAIVILFIDVYLTALRLCWLFRPHGLRLSLGMSLQLTLVACFFSAFLSGAAGGDLAKLFYATRENSGLKTEIITVMIFDRVIGLFSMLLLPLLFAPMFPQLIQSVRALRILLFTVALLCICMLVGFLVCLWNQSLMNRLGQSGFGFPKWRSFAMRALEAIRTYRESPGILVAVLGAAVLANLSLIGVTALGMLLVNPSGMSMRMCLVIPMGYVANSLPLTPGGLGVGETAFGALFDLAGLRGGADALLSWRIWSAFVSISGLILYLRGLGRSMFRAAEVR